MRILWLLMMAALMAGSGCRRELEMTEANQKYAVLRPSDVPKVPVILEGKVVATGVPAGPARNSPLDGRWAQLWKVRVNVENVLQGDVASGDTDIFYFVGDIPGSLRSINLRAGERNIFFLRRDRGKLRTVGDRAANHCLLKVVTGPHPNFQGMPGASINETIIDLMLSRGSGVDDKQMLAAIDGQRYSRFVGEEEAVKKLQQLAERERPVVREAACAELLSLNHECGRIRPAVTVQNLSQPAAKGTFKVGDRIRTDVSGAPHALVSRADLGQAGALDGSGHFTFLETIRPFAGRIRTEVWLVGAEEVSPAVSYVMGSGRAGGEIISTEIGNPRDRYGMGMSALSVSGDTVVTFSSMMLNYPTSLYYDAQEMDTLYEDSKPIRSGKISGGASARILWETKVSSWRDYFVQSGHSAVAAFEQDGFANPLGFAQGSCFGVGSNCQIMPVGGPPKLAGAAIFLGNTGGDETAVPQGAGWALKMLDLESKATVVDSLLTRGQGMDDAQMIALIDGVAREPQFGEDLIVKKLQAVAERETETVRAEACKVLREMKHPCGKRHGKPPVIQRPVVVPQQGKATEAAMVEANRLRTAAPKYVVVTIFLLMTKEMEESKLVAAFRLKWLSLAKLYGLEAEASGLTRDLAELDLRASRVTATFRHAGQLALGAGKALPPAPSEIYRLQAMRTAAMVNHVVSLEATLGPKDMMNLEAMLAYQFTPDGNFAVFAHGDHQ